MSRQKLRYSAGIAMGLGIFTLAVAVSQAHSFSTPATLRLDDINSQLLAQQQQPRTALIIANYDYEDDYDLIGPRQDAVDMYEKLKSLGFDVPPPVTNATKQQMEQAVRDFVQRMNAKGPGGANVFYYSGHGVQINGVNYLLPVGLANTSNEIDVEYYAVRLDFVANQMYSVLHEFNFLIIDACRNNLLLRRWNRPKGPGSYGLTFIAPPPGTMIVYAAEPGEIAYDGDDNSVFTASVLDYLGRSGIDIYEMLHRVRNDVVARTGQGQFPQIPAWEGSPNAHNFSFNPTITTATTPDSQQTPQPASTTSLLGTPPSPPDDQQYELFSRLFRPDPTLISATTGVNYQPLKNALVAGDYRLADETTRNLMLRAVGLPELGGWFLREEELRNFPCDDLKIVDQLWLDHSDGKFGFSIQQEIYQSLGGTLGQYDEDIHLRLGEQLGWRHDNKWLRYHDLNFQSRPFYSQPAGHLPAIGPGVFGGIELVGYWSPEEGEGSRGSLSDNTILTPLILSLSRVIAS